MTAAAYGRNYGPTNPPPITWDADRSARGGGTSHRGARCTTRGCPVIYRSGQDRPCREHAGPDETAADVMARLYEDCGQPDEEEDAAG